MTSWSQSISDECCAPRPPVVCCRGQRRCPSPGPLIDPAYADVTYAAADPGALQTLTPSLPGFYTLMPFANARLLHNITFDVPSPTPAAPAYGLILANPGVYSVSFSVETLEGIAVVLYVDGNFQFDTQVGMDNPPPQRADTVLVGNTVLLKTTHPGTHLHIALRPGGAVATLPQFRIGAYVNQRLVVTQIA